MTDTLTIRPAGFQDVNAIFALIRSYPEFLLPRAMGDLIQNIDRCLVAETVSDGDAADGGDRSADAPANRLLGTVSWQILPEIGVSGNPSVEIKSLAVRADRRGSGIGRRLVTAAIERIAVFRPREIIVLTFTPDFFTRLGFVATPKERLMHKLYMGCMNCTRYDSPFTCPEVAMALLMDAQTTDPRPEGD